MSRFFDLFQVFALVCLLGLGFGRAFLLYSRGIRVVVIDRQRSMAQTLVEICFLVCFFLWVYEIVAYAWPLRVHFAPQCLGTVIVAAVAIKVVGVVLLVAGLLIYGMALWAMGESWRIGIDRNAPGALVTLGVFAWTRNPIYIALDLFAVGTFLVQVRLFFLLLAILMVVMFHYQIRREERFLMLTYEDAYRDYCKRVGRYGTFPKFSRGN